MGFRSLASVARHLPFHLNETDKVNAAFLRWQQEDDDEAKYHIDLWTYCFVQRYFLVKFTRDTRFNNTADLDGLVEQCYRNVQEHQAMVADSEHYAGWVSVVCKHVYLNYLRSAHQIVALDEAGASLKQSGSLEALDIGMLHQGLCEAIERLPPFLREVARYRFLEGYSYQEISEITEKPLPIVRSYVNKAVRKLRKDPLFLAYFA